MFLFKDKTDQEWSVELNLGILHQITNGGINFNDVTKNEVNLINPDEVTLQEIMFNPLVTMPIIWFCVKDDVDTKYCLKKITADQRLTFSPEKLEEIEKNLSPGFWFESQSQKIYEKVPFTTDTDISFYTLFNQTQIEEVAALLLHEVTSFFPLLTTTTNKLTQEFSRMKRIAEETLKDQEIISDENLKKLVEKEIQKVREDLEKEINSGN